MHLTPHEQERLMVHVARDVVRRRECGLPLNYPEVMALLTAYVYEEARAGATVDSIMESGRHVLTRGEVMDGVPEMIDNVWVEATFPDGTKLVTIHDPFEKLAEDEENKKTTWPSTPARSTSCPTPRSTSRPTPRCPRATRSACTRRTPAKSIHAGAPRLCPTVPRLARPHGIQVRRVALRSILTCARTATASPASKGLVKRPPFYQPEKPLP